MGTQGGEGVCLARMMKTQVSDERSQEARLSPGSLLPSCDSFESQLLSPPLVAGSPHNLGCKHSVTPTPSCFVF